MPVEHLFDSPNSGDGNTNPQGGVWIGVDLGTSNSAAAVWDSHGGRSKWMRLTGRSNKNIHSPSTQLARPEASSKPGRIVPSAILFRSDGEGASLEEMVDTNEASSSGLLSVLVGQAGWNVLDRSLDETDSGPWVTDHYTPAEVAQAFLTSIKRVFGLSGKELRSRDRAFVDSLPFSIQVDEKDESLTFQLQPLSQDGMTATSTVQITPLQATAILLRSIRLAAQDYMVKHAKKQLLVPGGHDSDDSSSSLSSSLYNVRNCVVGVPAHFSHAQRHLMCEACRMAGFDGHVSTLTESTAAILSYGLFVSNNSTKSILVLDIGGGTTDCSIAVMSSLQDDDDERQIRVVVTEGDGRLGGDDMDEVLATLVLNKLGLDGSLDSRQRRSLLRNCRLAKECLCGSGLDGHAPIEQSNVSFEGLHATVSQDEFNAAIRPFMDRARTLVETAIERFANEHSPAGSHGAIDEVVLVGGATRVPAVRRMLQSLFPSVELCTSVNPDSACAQGLAIQAAIRSGLVPKHELRSALMLDALPHAIGVKTECGDFIQILPKDSTLPSRGYATFTLADAYQRGVTIVAVEDIGDRLPMESLGVFTFLLRKLGPNERLSLPDGHRSVDVGFAMEQNGEFIVSIFDANDPDHVRKRLRYEEQKAECDGTELGYRDTVKGDGITLEQVPLILSCVLLFALYIALKLAFHEPQGGSIIQ